MAEAGTEPVRDWLRALFAPDRKLIGGDIKSVQFGWPLGMPLVDHRGGDIWEVLSRLYSRIARTLFATEGSAETHEDSHGQENAYQPRGA